MLWHWKFSEHQCDASTHSTLDLMWWVPIKTQVHSTQFIQPSQGENYPRRSCQWCYIFSGHIPLAPYPMKTPWEGNKMACVKAKHPNSKFPMMLYMGPRHICISHCVFLIFFLSVPKILLKFSKGLQMLLQVWGEVFMLMYSTESQVSCWSSVSVNHFKEV